MTSRRISAASAITRSVSGEFGKARRSALKRLGAGRGRAARRCSAIAWARSASVRLVIANGASVMSPSGSGLIGGRQLSASCH